MKINKIFKIITLSVLIVGCGQNSNDEKLDKNNIELDQSESNEKVAETNIEHTQIENKEIAKFAIAAIMNQKPEIINVTEDYGHYYVSYKRPDDGKKFEYKIKINGKNITWGNADGRWRDTKYDERISYYITKDKLTVVQTFDDGSKTKKDFNIVD